MSSDGRLSSFVVGLNAGLCFVLFCLFCSFVCLLVCFVSSSDVRTLNLHAHGTVVFEEASELVSVCIR